MDYTLSGDNKTINAHKIWACHKNIVVALINGKAPGVNDSIFTALDQSRWQGTVEVNRVGNAINTHGSHEVKNIRWLYHSGVGYILPNPSTVKVHVNNKTSSWSAINESASPRPITDKVFMPLLYHPNFNNSAFAYVIAACNSSGEVMQLANKPAWHIIVNNARVQGVRFNDGVIMAAFHSSGTLLIKNKNFLTVDKPCLVQITRDSLFISDPLHKGGRVNFSVNGKKYSTALNSDGTTVSVKI
jgi:chondroitin AC lyase